MLVKSVFACDLFQDLRSAGREGQFSYAGCEAIVNYFDDCCIDNTNYDLIGICCDFTEESPDDIINTYSNIEEIAACKVDGVIDIMALLDALNERTFAELLSNGNILYCNF